MSTVINYNSQRKAKGDTYFLQYPNGNNIAALWKMFWSVKIEHDENIHSVEVRVFDSTELSEAEFNMAIMQLPLLFSHYNTEYKWGLPKRVILKPKEPIKFLDNVEGIIDTKTVRIVTQAEHEKLRSSIWFIA